MLSVVVLTYNDPLRLRLCLHSLLRQTKLDYELIVTDDGGEKKLTLPVFEEIRRTGREITSVWLGPETSDFRAASARNAGLKRCHGNRVLFLDGDCILAPNVIAEHANYADANVLVCGARRHLPEEILAWLQPEYLDQLEKHVIRQDERYYQNGSNNILLRDRLFRGETTISLTHQNHISSFQLSAPMSLTREIGGFNEEFIGWGVEDFEFARRMKQAGASLLGRFDLLSYHIDHPRRKVGNYLEVAKRSRHLPSPVRNGGPMLAPVGNFERLFIPCQYI